MATQNPPAWATAGYPQAPQGFLQTQQAYYPQPVAGVPMAPQQAYMVQPSSMQPALGQAPISAQQPYTMEPSLPYDTKALHPQPGAPTYQMAAYPGAVAMYPPQAAPPPLASEGPPASSLSKESGSVLCPACHQKSVTNTTSINGSNTQFWALILGITTCCCCVPFCFDCFKDVQHRCSSCGALIATYMRSNGSTTTYY